MLRGGKPSTDASRFLSAPLMSVLPGSVIDVSFANEILMFVRGDKSSTSGSRNSIFPLPLMSVLLESVDGSMAQGLLVTKRRQIEYQHAQKFYIPPPLM